MERQLKEEAEQYRTKLQEVELKRIKDSELQKKVNREIETRLKEEAEMEKERVSLFEKKINEAENEKNKHIELELSFK